MVSHDSNTSSNLCDRVIWIDDGAVRESGAPEVVIPHYREVVLAAA